MYDFGTIEKFFGDLETYLIYQEEELERRINLSKTEYGKNEDGFCKYKIKQVKEEIKRVEEEIENRRLANS